MFDGFRHHVKRIAKEQGMTYAKIAQNSDIEESTIKGFMCGASDSRRVAEKIADVLGIGFLYYNGKYSAVIRKRGKANESDSGI